jgi:hypothetical protein
VKTAHGLVLEFQHSPISEAERSSREEFHKPMYWVVNGTRLKGDRRKFFQALRWERVVRASALTLIVPVNECTLLLKWTGSAVPVFFDFGDMDDENDMIRFKTPALWGSFPGSPKGTAYLIPTYRNTL